MKRNRLPNRDKKAVYAGLVSILGGCKLSSDDVLHVIDNGNPSMFQRVCRWVAADPLYRKIGLNQDSFKRAVGLWIAHKAGVYACTLDEYVNSEEYANEEND